MATIGVAGWAAIAGAVANVASATRSVDTPDAPVLAGEKVVPEVASKGDLPEDAVETAESKSRALRRRQATSNSSLFNLSKTTSNSSAVRSLFGR